MSKKTYFQYQKELNLPIYISVDLGVFESSFGEFLTKMKFHKLADKEEVTALAEIKKNNSARILHVSEASPIVAKQIQGSMESDRYGAESIIPKDGYRVYRHKDVGLMVYSFAAKEWQLGCYKDFGSSQFAYQARVMINRFLTWALVPHGLLGLWGVAVDDGMVAQRAIDSRGEVVFIDILGLKMITLDGVKKLRPHFKILRLDSTLKGRNIKMSNEELLSFLSAHCSYLDSSGLSVPVRQMIQALSRMTEGLIHPQESFRPRTDLSL
ncbi:MAG: hypothetical protein Q7U04_05440 [Bacteriovorax sp.]|nr:hypothetical protein [Bacteriovorax sp.]